MSVITKLITGRAVVAAAIVALLETAKHFGLEVPDDATITIDRALDAIIVLSTLFLTGAAHRADAPEDKGDDPPPPRPRISFPPLALVLSLFALGCSGRFEEARSPHLAIGAAPPSERCVELDDRHALAGASAKFWGALAGGSGLAAIPVEDDKARLGLAIGSGVSAAIAISAGFVADHAAERWAAECADR